MTNETSPHEILRNEYYRRKAKNPNYSQRAFAKALEIPSGRLTEYLNRTRKITVKSAIKISSKLKLEEQEKNAFVSACSKKIERQHVELEFLQLKQDQYDVLADWHHYAILNLMKTDDFESDVTWISKRLGLDLSQVNHSLSKLKRLGLIQEENAQFSRTDSKFGLTTSQDIPCEALRESHRQNIDQAREALETVPVGLRDITSITMPSTSINSPSQSHDKKIPT